MAILATFIISWLQSEIFVAILASLMLINPTTLHSKINTVDYRFSDFWLFFYYGGYFGYFFAEQ